MKNILLLSFIFISFFLNAQDSAQSYLERGIELHDQGKYKEAIRQYKKGLKLDKNSTVLEYEIGYSYYGNGEYKKAIKYFDKVIKNQYPTTKDALVAKGNCLDIMGKSNKAIETFNQALEIDSNNYLLFYNLALAHYNNDQLNFAEENVLKAIELNPYHPGSNYFLGVIKMNQKRRIESLLAFLFYLYLEPNTQRSRIALQFIENQFNKGISKNENNGITITINEPTEEDDFSSIDMMLSILAGGSISEEISNGSEQEAFYRRISFFVSSFVTSKVNKSGLYWDLYVDFLTRIQKADHLETFSYIISQSKGDVEKAWLQNNPDKLESFEIWLSNF